MKIIEIYVQYSLAVTNRQETERFPRKREIFVIMSVVIARKSLKGPDDSFARYSERILYLNTGQFDPKWDFAYLYA